MKKHRLWGIAAHGSAVMSVVFIVLFVLDRFNPAMEFIGSEQGHWLLLIFCLISLADGLFSAVSLFRREEKQHMRREQPPHSSSE